MIVQTASISAFDGQVTMVPYAAAKGAIVSMTLPMARDLAPLGIRVCAIAPGRSRHPGCPHRRSRSSSSRRRLPEARRTTPTSSPPSSSTIVTNPYLNGEVIRLDGGARLSPHHG